MAMASSRDASGTPDPSRKRKRAASPSDIFFRSSYNPPASVSTPPPADSFQPQPVQTTGFSKDAPPPSQEPKEPNFVPVPDFPPFHITEHTGMNKGIFRYVPAIEVEPFLFHTQESLPQYTRVSWEDRSPYVRVTKDGLRLAGDKGFRSARMNVPVREGKWYMEVKIDRGWGSASLEAEDGAADNKVAGGVEGPHVRLGWGRREAPLNAPVGLDGYSYGMRDKTGEKVTLSRPKPYGHPFREGDVIGLYISLPPCRQPNPKDPHDPAQIKRNRRAVGKNEIYFESLEYAPAKEMITLMDQGSANVSKPSNKNSATVKNLPNPGDRKKVPIAPDNVTRPLPMLGPTSRIGFFVNGECQGTAFSNLYDYLPLRQGSQVKKTARKGRDKDRENPFDDGTLGYYPFISLFRGAIVTLNPGPNFEFPPPADIDGLLNEMEGNMVLDDGPTDHPHEQSASWRPLSERYPEYVTETKTLDIRDEDLERKIAAQAQAIAEKEAERLAEKAKKKLAAEAKKKVEQEARAAPTPPPAISIPPPHPAPTPPVSATTPVNPDPPEKQFKFSYYEPPQPLVPVNLTERTYFKTEPDTEPSQAIPMQTHVSYMDNVTHYRPHYSAPVDPPMAPYVDLGAFRPVGPGVFRVDYNPSRRVDQPAPLPPMDNNIFQMDTRPIHMHQGAFQLANDVSQLRTGVSGQPEEEEYAEPPPPPQQYHY